MKENLNLEIAKLIGEPINTQLPVPYEIEAIADLFTAEAGEHVWRYSAMDSTADVILDVDTDGVITEKKRSALSDVELTFKGLNSKLEYVLVEDVLSKPDTQVLGRRKASITRGMDKRELKIILDAILAKTAGYLPGVNPEEVIPATAEDIYDVIMAMKHKIEDYGDQFVLLCGSTAKEKIDTYDKEQATSLHYNVTLPAKLKELGIEVVKVFGKVSSADNEAEEVLMDAKKLILVAKNSRIAEGKPIKFVRRKIPAEVAELMGAEVDTAQRALSIANTPAVISGTNTLGFGIFGYESIIFFITNPKAICIADCNLIL